MIGRILSIGLLSCLVLAFVGCASSQETAEADTLTKNVGKYPPPPPGIAIAKVGVPPFLVTESGKAVQDKSLGSLAADQLTSLVLLSNRFEVIERAQLGQLLREQGLEGVVDPSQLAKSGKVSGVDYLIYGKITNLRVKAEQSGTGINVASLPIPFVSSTGFDWRNKKSRITVECGVDLRMVDPTTGRVVAAHFGEFKRTDSIGAWGISILGVGAQADANLQLTEDNKGKILRLALDEALKKMLPQIDAELLRLAKKRRGSAAAGQSGTQAAASTIKCPSCGKPVQAGAKFCPHCGKQIPQTKPKTEAPKFCPSCGKPIKPGDKFCGNCGAKLTG